MKITRRDIERLLADIDGEPTEAAEGATLLTAGALLLQVASGAPDRLRGKAKAVRVELDEAISQHEWPAHMAEAPDSIKRTAYLLSEHGRGMRESLDIRIESTTPCEWRNRLRKTAGRLVKTDRKPLQGTWARVKRVYDVAIAQKGWTRIAAGVGLIAIGFGVVGTLLGAFGLAFIGTMATLALWFGVATTLIAVGWEARCVFDNPAEALARLQALASDLMEAGMSFAACLRAPHLQGAVLCAATT